MRELTAMVGGGEAARGNPRHIDRSGSAANGKATMRRPGEAASSLPALRKAISHPPNPTEPAEPAQATEKAPEGAFPLEDHFKEF